MTTNEMPPYSPGEPEPLGQLFREVLDMIDESVDRITDDEVDERLRRLLAEAGYDDGRPEPAPYRTPAPLDLGEYQPPVDPPEPGAPAARQPSELWTELSPGTREAIDEAVALAARRVAEALAAEAERAAETTAEAARRASEITAGLNAYADEVLDRASAQASALLAEARERAARIVADAEDHAAQITAAARQWTVYPARNARFSALAAAAEQGYASGQLYWQRLSETALPHHDWRRSALSACRVFVAAWRSHLEDFQAAATHTNFVESDPLTHWASGSFRHGLAIRFGDLADVDLLPLLELVARADIDGSMPEPRGRRLSAPVDVDGNDGVPRIARPRLLGGALPRWRAQPLSDEAVATHEPWSTRLAVVLFRVTQADTDHGRTLPIPDEIVVGRFARDQAVTCLPKATGLLPYACPRGG